MAWTAPRTWVTNELVTAAIMNTHVRDNLNQLRYLFEGALSTTPPGSPVDGQLWAMAPSTAYVWTFRYNAGSASAFKWEFVGGAPIISEIATNESTTSPVYVDLTTVGPAFTIPRAGDYLIENGADCSTTGWGMMSVTATDAGAARWDLPGSTVASSTTRALRLNGLTTGQVIKTTYRCSGATTAFTNRWMKVTPFRVS